jgi:hypothetical protein
MFITNNDQSNCSVLKLVLELVPHLDEGNYVLAIAQVIIYVRQRYEGQILDEILYEPLEKPNAEEYKSSSEEVL